MNKTVERAIADPLRVFDTPMDVVEASGLSREEKVQILENWELDARRLIESAGENMLDEKGSERDQLPDIQRALRKLGAKRDDSAKSENT
jgi:hypothetical protein